MLRHDDSRRAHRRAANGGHPEPIPFVGSIDIPSIHHNPDGWEALAEAVFAHPGRPVADLRERQWSDAPVAPVIDLETHRRRRSEGR